MRQVEQVLSTYDMTLMELVESEKLEIRDAALAMALRLKAIIWQPKET